MDFYYVDVIRARDLSNTIADKLGVTHQSPQLIYVRDGEAAWNGSHHEIQKSSIDDALEK